MGRTACTEPQCLYKGAFSLYLVFMKQTQCVSCEVATKFLHVICTWCNVPCTHKHNGNSNGTYCSLSIPVGSLYVRKFFKEEAKTTAMEMVDDIRKEFINILMNVDWMDEKTK